jgi:protein-S-isoprenylcysteine O-methyltransferase Ste14
MIYVIMVGTVGWVAFLNRARRKAPPRYRKPAVWAAVAGLLLEAAVLLPMLAQQRHWTLHRSVLGVGAFLLPVAGLACLAIGGVAWRHGRAIAFPSQEPADS